MELLYPALSAPLAIVAVRAWARWARCRGSGPFLIGVLACAGAVDATRALLRHVEDVPGDGPSGTILTLALAAAAALLVVRAWRDLGRDLPSSARGPKDRLP